MGTVGTVLRKKRLRGVMTKVNYYDDYSTRPFGYKLQPAKSSPGPEAVLDVYTRRLLPITTIRPETSEWAVFCASRG